MFGESESETVTRLYQFSCIRKVLQITTTLSRELISPSRNRHLKAGNLGFGDDGDSALVDRCLPFILLLF